MPLITETYYLSLTQDNRGILRLRCSQDDTLRTVNLKLYNNGSIFVIPSGISASISGVKQNGAVFSKPCTISQNRESVVLQLSSDITNVDGIIVAEIVLNDGEGGRLGTSNFIIQVEKNPIRAGVVQDTETPIEYINDFIEKIQTLTARLNNLITPSGDPSLAEVVDARNGILDSTTYPTLGARLNAEFQRLSNVLTGAAILESTGDTTDRTSEILSKLNVYGTCKLGKGDFYVNSLVMPEGSHLIGSGKSTRIILPNSVTDGYVVKPRSNCIIENISFYGGFTGTHSELIASGVTTTRHCIILDRFNSVSSENVILNNIFINNFVGSAVIQRYTIGCHCEDIIINMCYAGIDISNASYDGQCTNISMTNTRYGVVQNGSNFVFTNCVSKDSDRHIRSDQQNTECTFSSCTFSDSSLETTSRLATLSNARNGFIFDNCIFDSSLNMLLNACDGIVIKGTNFVGSDTFAITVANSRNSLLLITDCIADVEPTVTDAGTAARITSCYLKDGTAWTISEADITVDDELSDESENPVQNKVINREISEIKADLGDKHNKLDSYLFSVNLFDVNSSDNVSGYILSNGLIGTNANYMTSGYIEVKPNTKYYVSGGYKTSYGVLTVPFLLELLEDKSPSTYHTDIPYYFTTGATTKYVRFTYRAEQAAGGKVGLSELEIPITGVPPKYDNKVNARKTSIPQAQTRIMLWKADSVSANVIMGNTGFRFSPRKNSRIAFTGNFTSFTSLVIGLTEFGGSNYNRLVIDNTKVTAYNYNGTTTEYTHGLTITNNIQVLLEIGFAFNCNLTLVSNGVAFTQNNIRWDGKYNTYVYAKSAKAMTDCVISWTSVDMNKSIWMFGDSYFGYTNHWTYWLNQSGYINNCLMNAYPGEGSSDAVEALKTYLQIACPQKVVWCMGMNDGSDVDSTTPSNAWKTAFDELVLLSSVFGFEVVVATIPTVPTINHVGQNYYVQNSGFRVVDFASAVGAQSDGTWYSDMLSSDGVHPSATGARALYMRFISDFPEIMISD